MTSPMPLLTLRLDEDGYYHHGNGRLAAARHHRRRRGRPAGALPIAMYAQLGPAPIGRAIKLAH
jgi:hypothetical protein